MDDLRDLLARVRVHEPLRNLLVIFLRNIALCLCFDVIITVKTLSPSFSDFLAASHGDYSGFFVAFDSGFP